MAVSVLDTHQTVKDLTAAGFSDAQAEALTYALRQVQNIDLSELATKQDIAELRDEIAELRGEMAELRGKTAELRDEMATKKDLADLRSEMKTELARAIAEVKFEMIKWFVGIAFAQAALIIAILRLFPGGHP
jgi:hypothetical protein